NGSNSTFSTTDTSFTFNKLTDFADYIKTDQISEYTSGSGITFNQKIYANNSILTSSGNDLVLNPFTGFNIKLPGVQSSTISVGGFLGLDSSGNIVKSNTPTITLSSISDTNSKYIP